ncbi:hypothetical protein [Actinospica sp.]|jgi:hypothetical protein|uniref:hypothetical protein n=1 Tax=Actinospica sp. TaxID=1872142 RepID=UPI002B8FBB5F|nr:hypothetical protein [Actinospica sp.]HWG28749.1 hypothetical protein [Actinospica sp.]
MVVVVVFLGLALPCWALTVRARALGWKIAGVLAALLLGEISVAAHWIFPGARVTLLVLLALATSATLLVGVVSNAHPPVSHRRHNAGRRTTAGLVLCYAFCGVTTLAAVGAALVYGVNGLPSTTPPASDILPLPSGLTVVDNLDEHCSGGSTVLCLREIDVAGAQGQDQATIIAELDAHAVARGWQSGTSCRTEGVLLDRHQECVNVGLARGQLSVQLENSSGW